MVRFNTLELEKKILENLKEVLKELNLELDVQLEEGEGNEIDCTKECNFYNKNKEDCQLLSECREEQLKVGCAYEEKTQKCILDLDYK